jgi:hypothetical protein
MTRLILIGLLLALGGCATLHSLGSERGPMGGYTQDIPK